MNISCFKFAIRNPKFEIAAIVICSLFLAASPLYAGDTLRVAFYNALNYPGVDSGIRNPYFRTVFASMRPDVLVTGEMTSQAGIDMLCDALNAFEPGAYASVPYHHGVDTDNALFYRTSVARFDQASYISTDLRDIAEYKVTVLSSGERINLYAVHLKAGSTTADASQRLTEATTLRNYLNALPQGTKFMVLGDFNVYTSTEACYQKLIATESNNNGLVKDPLNKPGSWHNNSGFSAILTQSPRISSFDGGTGGGLDDRFDFILTSPSLDSNTIVSRYKAFGNDGTHFNDSINHLPNHAVPDSVAIALYRAADHLPIMCDFVFAAPHYDTVNISVRQEKGWNLISLPVDLADTHLSGLYPNAASSAFIYDTTGYYPIDFFEKGIGLWLKFADTTTTQFKGRIIASNAISLYKGWNLVGSISDSVSTTGLTFDPPDVQHSDFFGYNNGYYSAPTILPGKAYWIKSSGTATVVLKP